MAERKLRVLAVGAHPDDCEYHFGGTAAKYLSLGHTVKFVSMTNGNAGHQSMGRKELAAARLLETQRVSELFGVQYEVLGNDDGSLTDDLKTRDELIGVIRRFQPDLLFTHRTCDYHTDHRHTGLLVQDASFLLGVPHVCPDAPCLRSMPVILSFFDRFKKPVAFECHVAVDTTDTAETKARMLDCHRSQFYDWLPWVQHEADELPETGEERLRWLAAKMKRLDADVAERCRGALAARYGEARGRAAQCAEAYEASEYGAPLTESGAKELFPF